MSAACSQRMERSEISADKAIQVARSLAETKKYNLKEMETEIIKCKDGIEKGPVRINWLFYHFRDETPRVIKNDFWIVYLYPKSRTMLGGDFTVLVDLYNSDVLAFNIGM